METAPQDVQQRLKHDWPLASHWLGQQTNKIRETTPRDREPNINLSRNESQIRDRQQQGNPQSPTRDGRASVLILGGFRPTSVEGLVQHGSSSLSRCQIVFHSSTPYWDRTEFRRRGDPHPTRLACWHSHGHSSKRAPLSWKPSPPRGPTS